MVGRAACRALRSCQPSPPGLYPWGSVTVVSCSYTHTQETALPSRLRRGLGTVGAVVERGAAPPALCPGDPPPGPGLADGSLTVSPREGVPRQGQFSHL